MLLHALARLLPVFFVANLTRADISVFFPSSPTREAGERLAALNDRLELRRRHLLLTHGEARAYLVENRGLAEWYLRSIVRAQLSRIAQLARRSHRSEAERDRLRNRALAEAASRGETGPASAEGGRSVPPPTVGESSSDAWAWLAELSAFVERLTNRGIAFRTITPRDTSVRVKTGKREVLLGLDAGFAQLDIRAHALRRDGEVLAVHATRVFPREGVTASLSYGTDSRSLHLGVSKQLLSFLVASAGRAWPLAARAQGHTSARLDFSLQM